MVQIKSNNKKILFISRHVPPIGGSHSRRVINFLTYIDQFCLQLDVLTILPASNYPLFDSSSLKYIPKSMKIYRVKHGIYNIYCNETQKISSNTVTFWNKILALCIRKLKFIGIETNTHMLVDWTILAVKKGNELLNKHTHNIIISSGNSETHIVAYIIKIFNKNVHWIVDYGDPWVFAPDYMMKHTRIKFAMDHWFETHMLKSANIIIVTTEETKRNYLQNYPFLEEEKVRVIPMGTDYDIFKRIHADNSDKFRIVYTGSIYAVRDITQYFKAVKLLIRDRALREKIEILFVGDIEKEYHDLVKHMGLWDVISFRGFVPYEESLSIMKSADVLISFGNSGGLQVPGKLFDYVGSKKPILWIKGDENDPALRYLDGLEGATIVENDCRQIYPKIKALYHLYEENTLKKTGSMEELPAFSWKNRGKMLNDICDEVMHANRR